MRPPLWVPVGLLVAASLTSHAACAEDAPSSILGFFKPGDYVGVKQGPPPYTINKYSKERFAITVDERVMKPSELAAKYPAVAEQIEKKWAELLEARQDTGNAGKDGDDERMQIDFTLSISQGTRLGRVISVGENYVLVAGNSPRKFKIAIAIASIASINWVDDELPLHAKFRTVER